MATMVKKIRRTKQRRRIVVVVFLIFYQLLEQRLSEQPTIGKSFWIMKTGVRPLVDILVGRSKYINL